MKEGCFSFVFVSHSPIYFKLAMNSISFPQITSVLPMTVIGKQCPYLYLDPQVFYLTFSTHPDERE